MRRLAHSHFFFAVVASGLVGCGATNGSSAPPSFRASSTLQILVSSDLEGASAELADAFTALNPGIVVDVDAVGAADLVGTVQQRVDDANAPDLVIGHHVGGQQLADDGTFGALCADADPFCNEECIDTPTPAPWCVYARGDGFEAAALPDYPIAAYCDPGGCPAHCTGPNPPRWCDVIDEGSGADVWQGSVASRIQQQVEPLGIPLSWNPQVVLVNEGWFSEKNIDPPTKVAEVMATLHDHPGEVWADSSVFFDLTGAGPSRAGGDPSPDPMIVSEPHPQPSIVADGDPSPDPMIVGIMIVHASVLRGLSEELLDALEPVAIEGYRPGASVAAIWPLPDGAAGARELALDFATFAYSGEGREVWDSESRSLSTSQPALQQDLQTNADLEGAAALSTEAQLVSLAPVLPPF